MILKPKMKKKKKKKKKLGLVHSRTFMQCDFMCGCIGLPG
jgi:hypothetical protein